MNLRSALRICLALAVACAAVSTSVAAEHPNVVLIYADDVGYGDVGCYAATGVETPSIDRLAKEGLRFTDGHSASATCTPSRYAMLTGEYAWRKPGTGIARGDAKLIIEPGTTTLASILKQAGYRTGVVGKWHLGLGKGKVDWNGQIGPGPEALGFDYSFLIPATGDRVPTVYVENGRVVGLDPADPIEVSFDRKIGDDPTGAERPDLLTMKPSHGHDMTIVNGISRIGYMTGGEAARWKDEEMADRITEKAVAFLEKKGDEEKAGEPFFLFFSVHDIHVPRVPHPRFVGKSTMGPRGDAIVQMDGCVGQILETLDRLGLAENTIVLFGSDNGPVVDDGYQDEAVAKLGDHRPAGPFRGGKYSAFEGGTRTPLIVRWPAKIAAGRTSDALVCQIDFAASFASLVDVPLPADAAPDSYDILPALLGESDNGRQTLVEHAGTLALRDGDWKLIVGSKGPKRNANTNTELGADPQAQLYDLSQDLGETKNLAAEHTERVEKMLATLEAIKKSKGSRPGFETAAR